MLVDVTCTTRRSGDMLGWGGIARYATLANRTRCSLNTTPSSTIDLRSAAHSYYHCNLIHPINTLSYPYHRIPPQHYINAPSTPQPPVTLCTSIPSSPNPLQHQPHAQPAMRNYPGTCDHTRCRRLHAHVLACDVCRSSTTALNETKCYPCMNITCNFAMYSNCLRR